jgi:hypothetical protein
MTIGDNSSYRTAGYHANTAGSIYRESVTLARPRGSFFGSDTAASAAGSTRLRSESWARESGSVNAHSATPAASSWQ